jgi:hypothetical protein
MIYYTDEKRHLVCTPYSIANLHRMAEDLGINRRWFHKNHYDIPVRRIEEIEAKCVKVLSKSIVNIINGVYKYSTTWSGSLREYIPTF